MDLGHGTKYFKACFVNNVNICVIVFFAIICFGGTSDVYHQVYFNAEFSRTKEIEDNKNLGPENLRRLQVFLSPTTLSESPRQGNADDKPVP